MSEEKVIYEVGVQGVSSTVSQINSIAGALAGVERAGQQAVASLSRIGEAVSAQLPQVPWFGGNNNRVGFTDLGAIIKKAKPFAGRLDPTGKQIFQNYKQQFVDLQSYLKKNFAFTDEEKRHANRYANFFGVGKIAEADKARIRANLAQINPLWKVNENWDDSHYFIPHMLFGEGWRIGDNPYATFDGTNTEKLRNRTSIRKKERQATHEYAERIRAANRARWGLNNPWHSAASESPIVPYINRPEAHISNPASALGKQVAKGASGKGIGKFISAFSKFGKLGAIIGAIVGGFALLDKAIKKAVGAFKELAMLLQTEASWREARESFSIGTTHGTWSKSRLALRALGGDPASASASLDRWSNELNMLAYGGNGGSLMEAARLFGLNIMGTGNYGFASPKEIERNIIVKMSSLSPSGQKALASTLGLDPYQRWAYSHGQEYYNKLTKRSLLRNIRDTDELYSDQHQSASLSFFNAFGQLGDSFDEFMGVLGEGFLPLITILIDLLEGIFEILSVFLKPIMMVLGGLLNLFSARWWEEQNKDMINQNHTDSGRFVFNINKIDLNSLGLREGATQNEIESKMKEMLTNSVNGLGEDMVSDRT